MGFFSRDIKTLDDLFVHTLRDIYYAENQIVKSLPDMISKATDAGLRQGFQKHLGETQRQIERLEQAFNLLEIGASGVDCPAIDGILEEAQEIAGEAADPSVMDAAILASAQAVEHYEITRYGTLIAWAKQIGQKDAVSFLEANLAEEKHADKLLTEIALAAINKKAA